VIEERVGGREEGVQEQKTEEKKERWINRVGREERREGWQVRAMMTRFLHVYFANFNWNLSFQTWKRGGGGLVVRIEEITMWTEGAGNGWPIVLLDGGGVKNYFFYWIKG
jgi:hypothetical protein